ncbi:hypothetical protein [Campylobacter concisus]|uniref:hypothetical protein n=1 Tax=Campylobacter concisus TaxID=199 RepID=UPI001CB84946|nr:hypothetical protein [Campylobacter concisus]
MQLRDEVEVKPDDVQGACNGAEALHAVYFKKPSSNFKIYKQAYHGSKFSNEWLRDLNLVVC